jgi:hypothetical protein
MIPRLASPFDGEVVATARAIDRVLTSHGLDWHYIARRINTPLAPCESTAPPSRPPRRPVPTWDDIAVDERPDFIRSLLEEAGLTAWELNFVAGVRPYWRCLTDRQVAVINRIILRCAEEGWL